MFHFQDSSLAQMLIRQPVFLPLKILLASDFLVSMQNLFEPVSDYRMDFLVLEKRLALVPQPLVVLVKRVQQPF
jgi:hypothetical protein